MINIFKGSMKTAKEVSAPIRRFVCGFEPMGAHTKDIDTRSQAELLHNLDYYASKMPEVSQFKEELKTMDPKHLSLVSDICELAERHEMLPTNIDLKQQYQGQSILQSLLSQLPKASKENPSALDFTQEVINQTDATTSKYFLGSVIGGILKNTGLSKHFEAAKASVKDIAESTIDGGYTMDFKPQERFMEFVKLLINPNADPEKIKILPQVASTVDKISEKDHQINVDKIIFSKTPASRIKQNLQHITH